MRGNNNYKQAGMVSILVTMIMMIVISLIVIGFAQVTRRNQREALDRQLSTQAYYAAESGVNYAQRAIVAAIKAGVADTSLPGSTDCSSFPGANYTSYAGTHVGTPAVAPFASANTLDTATKTAFTCLVVNPTPPELVAAPLNLNSSVVWHLKNADGSNFSSLDFTWAEDTPHTGGACSDGANQYKAADLRSCNFGVLRVDLMKVVSPFPTTAAGLASNTVTLYLQPTNGSLNPTITNFADPTHKAVVGRCVADTATQNGNCKVTVSLGGLAQGSEYYARLSVIYKGSSGVMVAGKEVGGSAINFSDGEALIDSTGRAQDELRRVKVYVPLTRQPGQDLPNFGLQSTATICKQLTVGPGIYNTGTCP